MDANSEASFCVKSRRNPRRGCYAIGTIALEQTRQRSDKARLATTHGTRMMPSQQHNRACAIHIITTPTPTIEQRHKPIRIIPEPCKICLKCNKLLFGLANFLFGLAIFPFAGYSDCPCLLSRLNPNVRVHFLAYIEGPCSLPRVPQRIFSALPFSRLPGIPAARVHIARHTLCAMFCLLLISEARVLFLAYPSAP